MCPTYHYNLLVLILKEGSLLIETVNEKLHYLHKFGFIDKWINDLVANSSNCDTIPKIVGSHGRGLQRLSMEQMQSFFYIIFGGLALSALGFTTEIIRGTIAEYRIQIINKRHAVEINQWIKMH